MVRLLVDQNFDERLLRGVQSRLPHLDIILARDAGLAEVSDPQLLEWASANDRVLVSHDARTVPKYAYERLAAGRRMAGVIIVRRSTTFATAIEDLLLILTCLGE